MIKQIINGRKNIYMQPAALKMPRKTMPNMAGWADKFFQGRTKIFSTIAENFYPRIKFFGRTIFFLTDLKMHSCVVLVSVHCNIMFKVFRCFSKHRGIVPRVPRTIGRITFFCALWSSILKSLYLLYFSEILSITTVAKFDQVN